MNLPKKIFDLFVASILCIVLIIPLLMLAILIKLSSKGPVLYWSDRVGENNSIFSMPKFRSMRQDTPEVPIHELENHHFFITGIGKFLRKTSIDEFPQLICVLKGEMSLVGPRPALKCQRDLIFLRYQKGISILKPGITGWAQINGRNKLSLNEKVNLDLEYLQRRSFIFDLKILLKTFPKVLMMENVTTK